MEFIKFKDIWANNNLEMGTNCTCKGKARTPCFECEIEVMHNESNLPDEIPVIVNTPKGQKTVKAKRLIQPRTQPPRKCKNCKPYS